MILKSFPDSDLPYLLYLPENLEAQEEWPLIVFLHGRGEGGDDLELVHLWGVPKYLDEGNELPAIVYVPQNEKEVMWFLTEDKVLAGIDALCEEYPINKVHLTGFSMGGHGTCYIGVNNPERFSTISPVALFMYPEADVTEKICVLKDKPVWVFYSEGDFIPVEHSGNVVKSLEACGATQLEVTLYDKANHTETADLAYFDEEFYQWMLQY